MIDQIPELAQWLIGIFLAFVVIIITCYQHADDIAGDPGFFGFICGTIFCFAFIWWISFPIYVIIAIITYVLYPWAKRRGDHINRNSDNYW